MDSGINIVIDNLPMYFQGFGMTLFLTISTLIVGLFIAVICAILKDCRFRLVRWFINSYSFFFRGTPCLVQIFLIYGLAQFVWLRESVLWYAFESALFCAWFALMLNTAAYTTEIIYGAIRATSRGELEAIKSFGFSKWQAFKHYYIPTIFRKSLPMYCNETIFLMQATALASTITVVELTQVARILNSRFFIPFSAYLSAAVFYMFISYGLIFLFRLLEQKYTKHLKL